jgi:hypothetical protein
MNNFKLLILFLVTQFLTGCISTAMIHDLNDDWATKNRLITTRLGEKNYDKVSKTEAMNAMVIAFQRLGVTVVNSDKNVGLIVGQAPAPSPLTKADMNIVISAEDANAKKFVPIMVWNFKDFESDYSVSFLETSNGVQVNVAGKLRFVGDRSAIVPVNQFPPKALEIGLAKIYDEFEKILFIQNRTLK